MNHTFLAHVFEGAVLSSFAAYQGSKTLLADISDKDWDRMTGPHALAFASVTAVLVLWATLVGYIYKSGKEAKEQRIADSLALEKRHEDAMEQQKIVYESLADIQSKSVEAMVKNNVAVETLARNIEKLTVKLLEKKEE